MICRPKFFNRDPITVAKALLGAVIHVKHGKLWLSASIIETEAYFLEDKASHASLGYTEKRKALFMPAGTIYMYYSRAGDSLNVSAKGDGNAVLIKSGFPYLKSAQFEKMIRQMQQLNPASKPGEVRKLEKLCNGQTLLCRALGLKVPDWDQQLFNEGRFYIEDTGYRPSAIIQATRLGIPPGRDEHLPYRFIDQAQAEYCTKKPLKNAK